ncbi:MBL fold metallo-hydrolase [Nostoc sp. FACHB-145]|uniref:MBL fold metallo-hydrolase n=1 Tax=Nostoc sp. FACHB-145 TaxID=2692836 RepID=UPI0016862A0F|nr:MBL fold metallo-hydrolase [Nostoc sp. FACHB-145]MBD2472287.1 MBL fold metallo-hydrolase [Nostoc sp. FACHB-145]
MKTTEIAWCISGEVKEGYLITENGERIKIRTQKQVNGAEDYGIWKCVPVTDSTGIVTTVSQIEKVEQSFVSYCIGRVTQVGKRNQTALVKISSVCKITFKTTNPLEVSGLYKLEFEYRDQGLHIVTAIKDGFVATKKPSLPESATEIVALKTEPTQEQLWQEKLEALIYAQFPDFCISRKSINRGMLEWEGRSENRTIRIAGKVGSTALFIHEFGQAKNGVATSRVNKLKVTALGAARSIGASCFKVEIGNYEIVLDAGTKPNRKQPLPAFGKLSNPNLILISHAHQDHIGALPVLHSMFPSTPMICTPGTREMAGVMWRDGLKTRHQMPNSQPLFDESDLNETLFRLETQPIGVEFEPLPGLVVKFINAGHIVGAACIYLKLGNHSLLYTGDYNLAHSRTTQGLELGDLPTADILITEATSGVSVHPSRKQQETELIQTVLEVVKKGGNVLISACALGQAPEIILALKTNAKIAQNQIPIYIDGLVTQVSEVLNQNIDLLPQAVQNMARVSRKQPFSDGVKVIAISDPSQRLLAVTQPSVIITDSQMLKGGAGVYYLHALLERKNAAILLSRDQAPLGRGVGCGVWGVGEEIAPTTLGIQAPSFQDDCIGRASSPPAIPSSLHPLSHPQHPVLDTDEELDQGLLHQIPTGERMTIDGQEYTLKAKLQKFNLSAHCDRSGIGQVIAKVAPRHLVLVHGSESALHELAHTDLQKHYIIHIPRVGDVAEYGVVPEFVGTAKQIELTHPAEVELEIVTEHDGAWIKVPKEVVDNDPRWQALSAMGNIRAQWKQSSLILSPVTLQSLLLEKAKESVGNCCAKCQFFENGWCQSDESPLSGIMIDPQGICLEFVKI